MGVGSRAVCRPCVLQNDVNGGLCLAVGDYQFKSDAWFQTGLTVELELIESRNIFQAVCLQHGQSTTNTPLCEMKLYGVQRCWIDGSLYLFHGGRVTGQIAWVLASLVYYWPLVDLCEYLPAISDASWETPADRGSAVAKPCECGPQLVGLAERPYRLRQPISPALSGEPQCRYGNSQMRVSGFLIAEFIALESKPRKVDYDNS
jgi:hypothetical protein